MKTTSIGAARTFAACGVAGVLMAPGVQARTVVDPLPQQATQRSDANQAATRKARVFGSDAGIVLNFIKPDKAGDFEAVIAKLREALQKSDKPERRRQATSWKVFKALDPGANGSVLYVFVIDPPAKGADYTVSSILAEAFPTDVQTLYQQYAGAYAAGQNVLNLTLVAALGQ